MRLARFASVAVLALAAGAAPADDAIPNPEFTGWAKFKKGTFVTVKTTSVAAGVTSEALSTTTLIEVGADKLVLEYVTVSKFNGMEFKLPPTKREVTKTFTLPKGVKKDDVTPPMQEVATENGTETIKVGGTEYKAKWTKTKVEIAGTTTEAKVWMSDAVPGTMVKMESTTTGKITSTTTVELVEFKQP